ncbi:MAG: DUF1295 domain-containing protein, partial [Paludibacteraceae bacterium]|nr:DUF1295 domain-containing protein [Paludibacteraceae bacterium]
MNLANLLNLEQFYTLLGIVSAIGLVVFISLYFVEAGYGKMVSSKWGPAINNKVAWVLMECPVFFVMLYLCLSSERTTEVVPLVLFCLFEFHYLHRSFIFPLLLKGKSKMPIAIMLMGVIFNLMNGFIQGYWIFFLSEQYNDVAWLITPQFIIGTLIFFTGIGINWSSDYIVRNLRKPGDTKHYLPKKGMYAYVTSANYFGEIVEWAGFAILTWSAAGLVFLWWTCANLVPRANSIYKKYKKEFADEFDEK